MTKLRDEAERIHMVRFPRLIRLAHTLGISGYLHAWVFVIISEFFVVCSV